MALRRFYIDRECLRSGVESPDCVRLHGDLVHHIRAVCRFTTGDEFEVLPGDGTAWRVRIRTLDNREIWADKISEREIQALPRPHIVLALSVPKLPKVDWIVEKAVELGVAEIRPFVSEFSFLRKVSEISSSRQERWQKLVQGATQQSGRGELMKIAPPTTLTSLLAEFNRSETIGGLFPYEGEANKGLHAALTELKARKLDQLWVFVGSEGGFSNAEVQQFSEVGLDPVSLGDQILRVETACLALVSIIKYENERFQ